MVLPSDYVSRHCIVEDKKCSLMDKCAECKKEIIKINEVEKMFKKKFEDLEKAKSCCCENIQ
jgi:hypothetical protein